MHGFPPNSTLLRLPRSRYYSKQVQVSSERAGDCESRVRLQIKLLLALPRLNRLLHSHQHLTFQQDSIECGLTRGFGTVSSLVLHVSCQMSLLDILFLYFCFGVSNKKFIGNPTSNGSASSISFIS
jgi:hypothetical protein